MDFDGALLELEAADEGASLLFRGVGCLLVRSAGGGDGEDERKREGDSCGCAEGAVSREVHLRGLSRRLWKCEAIRAVAGRSTSLALALPSRQQRHSSSARRRLLFPVSVWIASGLPSVICRPYPQATG